MIRILSGLALALWLAGHALAQDGPTTVDVQAIPIERFDVATPVGAGYGQLIFLGGLELRSSDPEFGGLSGLRLDTDGRRFTIVNDRGIWFRGSIGYEGLRPVSTSDVTRVDIPGRDGKPVAGRRGFDTEGLEIDGRTAWVSSERVHWLTRYALDARGNPMGAGKAVALPRAAASAPRNSGYEGLARLGSGALLMVAERFADKVGDNRAFVVGGGAPFPLSIRRTDDFSPTDLVRLPDGDLVLLERRYRPLFSLSIRLRRLSEQDVAPGAVLDGPVLMEASLIQKIDNFEALAAHRGPGGETVLTLISDDNFGLFQRTLLMQFALGR